MNRCFNVNINTDTGQGTYTVYYDVIGSENIAIKSSNSNPATGLTYNDLFTDGVNVSVPDCAKKLILYNEQCDVSIESPQLSTGYTITWSFNSGGSFDYFQVLKNSIEILNTSVDGYGCFNNWSYGDTIEINVNSGDRTYSDLSLTIGISTWTDNQGNPITSHIIQTITDDGSIITSTHN